MASWPRQNTLGVQRIRTRRGRRWAAFAVMVAMLFGIPAWSDAEDDVGVLAGILQEALSDAGRDVRIRGFVGALSSRATVEELSISDDLGVWITLSGVVIEWNRAALLNRQIQINELSAETIDIFRVPTLKSEQALPSPTARQRFSLPELPVSVFIGELSADSVRLDAAVAGQAAELSLNGAMDLVGGQGQARFEARRVDLQEGSFVFDADFDNATRVLSLALALSEGRDGIAASLLGVPGRPALGLSVQGEGPLSTFGAQIALSTDGTPRVSGQFALVDETPETGVLQGGGFSLDIGGDVRPLLSSELHPFFGARSLIRAMGQRSETGEIDLPELTVTTGAMNLSGRAAFGVNGLPRLVQLTAGIADPSGDAVLLPGTSGAGRIASATLFISHDAAVSRDWQIRAEIEQLDLPDVKIGSAILDANGRLNAAGSIADASTATAPPAFEGVFEFVTQDIVAQDPALQRALGSEMFGLASLVWPGPGAALELTGLALEANTVSLTAYGAIEGLNFDGYVELSAPDLSAFSDLAGRPLGGQALAAVQGQANPLTGALDFAADLVTTDLTIDIAEADALLAGQSSISVSLLRDLEGTQLRWFDLSVGAVEASMQGRLQPGLIDLRARLTTDDLSQMGPGYGGHVALDVLLMTEGAGEGQGQRLRFDGSTIDLKLADMAAAGLLAGVLEGANRLRGDLFIQGGVTDIAQFSVEGPHIAMRGSGVWSEADPDVTLSLERLELAAVNAAGRGRLSGALRLAGADGGTRRLSLSVNGAPGIRSGLESVDGLLTDGLTVLAQLSFGVGGGFLVDNATLQTTGLTVEAQGERDALGTTRLTARADLDTIARIVPGLQGTAALVGTVVQRAGQSGYDVNAELSGPSSLAMSLSGRIEDDATLALALAGQLEGALINTRIEPSNVSGLIRFAGGLAGPPAVDSLRLDLRTEDAHFVLPGAGVAFHNIEGHAQLVGLMSRIRVSGESLSGGRASLDGTIDLARARHADLMVQVEEFTVRHPQLFDARVNGSFALRGPLAIGALVQGEATVTQAEIRIPNSPLSRQGFGLQGLRHVGESSASRETRANAGIASGTRHGRGPIPLQLDLTLRVPGRVFVRGRGLDAELGGVLHLGGTTRDVIPSGSFGLIRGRLDLLGNRFTLTDGSASMVGDFVPFVTLVATTESDGVSTSVTLAGRADSPEITFGSIPELPQDEVLARLIFRRSLASLSPFQAAQLALSVATLTGRADMSVLGRTRQAMGLDDLDFTVDESGNTALRAGRYLTDQVYTDLSVDSTGRGEVTINLGLTPSITLRGRTDTAGRSGVGLFFERDY